MAYKKWLMFVGGAVLTLTAGAVIAACGDSACGNTPEGFRCSAENAAGELVECSQAAPCVIHCSSSNGCLEKQPHLKA